LQLIVLFKNAGTTILLALAAHQITNIHWMEQDFVG
jgi:hypothetical protein